MEKNKIREAQPNPKTTMANQINIKKQSKAKQCAFKQA